MITKTPHDNQTSSLYQNLFIFSPIFDAVWNSLFPAKIHINIIVVGGGNYTYHPPTHKISSIVLEG